MKYAQIVFSPTGGTKKAAEMIAGSWPDVERIDLSAASEDYGKYSFAPEDIVLIAMPSFGGLAPPLRSIPSCARLPPAGRTRATAVSLPNLRRKSEKSLSRAIIQSL